MLQPVTDVTHLLNTVRHNKILKTSASQSSGAGSGTSSFVKTEQPKVYEIFNTSAAYKSDSAKAKRVTLKIGRFVVKDLRPFSVVSIQSFCDLVYTLDPEYITPSRTYFSDTVIPVIYEQVKAKCKLLNLRAVKLIQDVSTRLNSAFDMLERFLELQPAVSLLSSVEKLSLRRKIPLLL